MRRPAFVASLGFHVTAIGLGLLAALLLPPPKPLTPVIRLEPLRVDPSHEPWQAPRLAPPGDPGTGGRRQPEPVRKGRPPSRAFLPPLRARVERPHLPLQVVLAEAPPVLIPAVAGLPAGMGEAAWTGSGSGNGLGDLEGPGAGAGHGPGGGGGLGGLRVYTGTLTRQPELLYKEEPQYTEAARKIHLQGRVVLRIEVGLDGRPANIQVIRSVGMGLDESAIEAVRKWVFRPAEAGGKPVVAPATVEVGFRLL